MNAEDLLSISIWLALPLVTIGTLLHFVYDWTGQRRWVALFASVNESYWEHIKIAFWPLFVYYAALFFLGGNELPGFIPAATVALYSVPVTMIATVFAYKRFAGRNILYLDILMFIITMLMSLMLFVLLSAELVASPLTTGLSLLFLLALLIAFGTYTLRPPAEPDFFIDPTNQRYGLDAHEQAGDQ